MWERLVGCMPQARARSSAALPFLAPQAERCWASKIIRGQAQRGQLPPLGEYLQAAQQRLRELAGLPDGSGLGGYQTT